jgi:hypothetical protein
VAIDAVIYSAWVEQVAHFRDPLVYQRDPDLADQGLAGDLLSSGTTSPLPIRASGLPSEDRTAATEYAAGV